MANPRQSPQEFFDSPKGLARFNKFLATAF